MNKFVKGAKNLAFALSFVTVAACGNVKKAELEAGLKGLEEKINSKLNGKADNGQGYALKSDVDSKIAEGKKELLGNVEKVKGEMISKKDVIKANVKSSGINVANLGSLGIDLKGEKFMVSVADSKVVVKRGDVVIYEEFKVVDMNPVKFIADVVSLKGEFVFDESFKPENRFKFSDGGADNKIKVGDFTVANAAGSFELISLLGKIGGNVFERFFDRDKGELAKGDKKVFNRAFTGLKTEYDKKSDLEKKEFGVGLEVLFGGKGKFVTGGAGGDDYQKKVTDSKFGFAFEMQIGAVLGIDLES